MDAAKEELGRILGNAYPGEGMTRHSSRAWWPGWRCLVAQPHLFITLQFHV